MIEQNAQLKELFASDKFRTRLLIINIDEVHVVYQWGQEFRQVYERLSSLRSLLPPGIPIFACSATLPPNMYRHVVDSLGIHSDSTLISLTSDRPNVYLEFREMVKSDSNSLPFQDLFFLVPSSVKRTQDLRRTIVYFER